MSPFTRSFRASIVARARFIDDLVAERAAQGVGQYVILGAGLDTFVHVAKNCYDTLTHDEQRPVFQVPAFLEKMLEKGMLGDKSGGGFYKKAEVGHGLNASYIQLRKALALIRSVG